MANILIIGGHGKIALQATPLLVRRGHTVLSAIRNPDHVADVEAAGARAVILDIEATGARALTRLLRDESIDAIVWSAGAGGGSPERTRAVDRDAAIRAIDAAAAADVHPFVMVSYLGAGPEHGVAEDNDFWHYAEAKAQADAHLRSSSLDWLILAPTTLSNDPQSGTVAATITRPDDNGYDAAVELRSNGVAVSRADVADLLGRAADAALTGALTHTTISFTGGDEPIGKVIAAAARDISGGVDD